ELRELSAQDDIPHEEQLRQLRDKRDQTLEQLMVLLGKGGDAGRALPDASRQEFAIATLLAEQMARADAYADRIREMASRVAERRAKEAAVRELAAQLGLRIE